MRTSAFLAAVVTVALLAVTSTHGVSLRSHLQGKECEQVTCEGHSELDCDALKPCCHFDGEGCTPGMSEEPKSQEPRVAEVVEKPATPEAEVETKSEAGSAEVIVLHAGGEATEPIANKVAEILGDRASAPKCLNLHGSLSPSLWGFAASYGQFGDGNPELLLDTAILDGKDVVLIADMFTPAEYFAQLSAMYTLQRIPRPRENKKEMTGEDYEYVIPKSLTIIIPYLPVARMERTSRWGLGNNQIVKSDDSTVVDVATARTMAGLLSARPNVQDLIPTYALFIDIHEYTEMARFLSETGAWSNEWKSDEEVMDLTTGKGKFFTSVLPSFMKVNSKQLRDTVIGFPDKGAFNRFYEMEAFASHRERGLFAFCEKKRVRDKVEMTYKEESPVHAQGGVEGKEVIIIDDFTASGSTLILATKAMLAEGATKVNIFVIHPVFDGEGYKKFLNPKKWEEAGVDSAKLGNIWVTDTINKNALKAIMFIDETEAGAVFKDKFKVFSVADTIADWVRNVPLRAVLSNTEEVNEKSVVVEKVPEVVLADQVPGNEAGNEIPDLKDGELPPDLPVDEEETGSRVVDEEETGYVVHAVDEEAQEVDAHMPHLPAEDDKPRLHDDDDPIRSENKAELMGKEQTPEVGGLPAM